MRIPVGPLVGVQALACPRWSSGFSLKAARGAADSLKQGQDIVVNTLQQKFADSSSVNIDEEMSKLLTLQMAYGANARVMTTVRDLLDLLMKA